MSALRLDSPLQYIKGVGPRRSEAFAELGLRTVADLLEHIPFRYEVSDGQVAIADLRTGVSATVSGAVTRAQSRYPGFVATVIDGSGHTCDLRWFQERPGGHGLYVGAQVIATGDVREYNDRLALVQPSIRVYAPDAPLPSVTATARPIPVYRASAQLSSAVIHHATQALLTGELEPAPDPLPPELLAKRELPERMEALRQVHAPVSAAALAAARRRLAYEELFLLELALALRKQKSRAQSAGQVLHTTPEIDRRIRRRFPFGLTAGQESAIRAIVQDLGAGRPMTRLLQGDVGCGKTVVALYAALVAVANKRQAAIMAPTELLAQQHYRNLQQYLAGSRVRHVLLSGALSRSERAAALSAIGAGTIDLAIGTQALIQKDVEFARLGLVVVDEQHRFGVLQRAAFRTRGLQPHALVMTATPIPRTLAMTVFGDLDVCVIRDAPPGRGTVKTEIVPAGNVERLFAQIAQRLSAGEQAYVVCPLIGEAEAAPQAGERAQANDNQVTVRSTPRGPPPRGTPARGTPTAPPSRAAHQSAIVLFQRLTAGTWRGLHVALLHGALPPPEKERILREFSAGKLQALVSTTVVEVGVDVANATIMVIESAERFGLAQLHQLRGRIGRGGRDGTCHLVVRTRNQQAAARLAVLLDTTDGFKIAEADLRQRGPGEFLGTRQHGLPELKFSDLLRDFAALDLAREDAFALAARDPHLKDPNHQRLRAAMRKLWAEKLKLIDAA